MSNITIGLTGRKRSGKDTFAARLIEAHGFTRVSFADPLREMALAIDPWVRVEQDELGLVYPPGTFWDLNDVHRRLSWIVTEVGWEKAKSIREVRRLLQVIGTDGVRQHISATAWIDVAVRAIEAIPGPVVVTDVRFPNEAEVCTEVARVLRPSLGQAADLHPSETAMDDYPVDAEVLNNADVATLHATADTYVGQLRRTYRF